ncbi:hypothetical protein M2322_002316 [Rhodoblastus acidophilus]|uniref:hypothetical protein n=1 Tax=Rhodoblastus acidophilus TaxID=1074 RepID=UPI00222554DC|nr:hypothetical protein [Rhodoblastus acidophilus]MCW2316762.1 hypothetical protein [Rhodoblastus acidophilus]
MNPETEFPAALFEMIGRRLGAQQAAFQLAAYSIIAALAERDAIDPARVIAWARFFAEQVAANKTHAEYEHVAANVQAFADGLQNLCATLEGTGRA